MVSGLRKTEQPLISTQFESSGKSNPSITPSRKVESATQTTLPIESAPSEIKLSIPELTSTETESSALAVPVAAPAVSSSEIKLSIPELTSTETESSALAVPAPVATPAPAANFPLPPPPPPPPPFGTPLSTYIREPSDDDVINIIAPIIKSNNITILLRNTNDEIWLLYQNIKDNDIIKKKFKITDNDYKRYSKKEIFLGLELRDTLNKFIFNNKSKIDKINNPPREQLVTPDVLAKNAFFKHIRQYYKEIKGTNISEDNIDFIKDNFQNIKDTFQYDDTNEKNILFDTIQSYPLNKYIDDNKNEILNIRIIKQLPKKINEQERTLKETIIKKLINIIKTFIKNNNITYTDIDTFKINNNEGYNNLIVKLKDGLKDNIYYNSETYNYDKLISRILNNETYNDTFLNKYLKYKNKYLKLKISMNK